MDFWGVLGDKRPDTTNNYGSNVVVFSIPHHSEQFLASGGVCLIKQIQKVTCTVFLHAHCCEMYAVS